MATARGPLDRLALVDRTRLDAVTDGDADSRAELIALFVQHAQRRVAECEAAGDDAAALVRAAHALRGSADSVGAPRLAHAALALEQGARPSDWLPALRSALDETLEELARL
jgi:HPt (histidine-containing phosphotransfer) domain-containing protein